MYVEFKLAELKTMMEEDSDIAAAVYHCLFKDRVQQKKEQKVNREREHVLGEYKTLLCAILADGLVHPQEREMCSMWRATHPEITDDDHLEMLDMLGWTSDQWDKGAAFEQLNEVVEVRPVIG
eukprot:TRINITY_DN3293_c0_g1_i1.p1 TRINITY_DN3293_c0_g1~~TRINITY_DN3293_c0_g1_i1.p1  ORF type:complete len:123 (+),score=42.69 TRINITY_DN3293_c0_g1_i1:135-503(+)